MYCIQCGSSNVITQIPPGDNRSRNVCQDCSHIHYTNPKIIVGTIPIFKDRILLCKRDIEPQKGFWNLPAGFLENGETLMEGAMRELWEEAIAKASNLQLHSIYNLSHVSQMYFFFTCDLIDGHYGVGQETADAKLFQLDSLPWDELAFSSNKHALKTFLNTDDTSSIFFGGS